VTILFASDDMLLFLAGLGGIATMTCLFLFFGAAFGRALGQDYGIWNRLRNEMHTEGLPRRQVVVIVRAVRKMVGREFYLNVLRSFTVHRRR
jgi:hypothetical protein